MVDFRRVGYQKRGNIGQLSVMYRVDYVVGYVCKLSFQKWYREPSIMTRNAPFSYLEYVYLDNILAMQSLYVHDFGMTSPNRGPLLTSQRGSRADKNLIEVP